MESNYYIYCIAQGIDSSGVSLKGFDEGEIILLAYMDICAVISPSNRARYDPTLENLECHENIINQFMGSAVVLPMRFSTIVKSQDDVKKVLEKYYPQFKENIKRLRGKVEMGIKIFCNINFAVQDEPKAGLSGKEYFLEKYKGYKEMENKIEPCLAKAKKINNSLSILCHENCCTNPMNNNLIMNASYLVPCENIEKFKKVAEDFKREYGSFKIILSGPWPPYHFIKIKEGD